MVEPLSLTTGILSILGVCIKVGAELKTFRESVKTIDARLDGLIQEVQSLEQVLVAMKDTFQMVDEQKSLQITGHIGGHWENLSRALEDGKYTLCELQEIIQRTNKDDSFLGGARKEMRLRSATDQIAMFRQRAQSTRDVLQLSLQTIILWNQITMQETNKLIPISLEQLHIDIRRIATHLNTEIRGLELTSDVNQSTEIDHARRLRNCVRSAASVLSSASTIFAEESGDTGSVISDSDFGDCFPPNLNDATLQWIESNRIEEERESANPQYLAPHNAVPISTQYLRSDNDDSELDSDAELDADLTRSLFNRGKRSLAGKDYIEAERLLKHCNSRLSMTYPESVRTSKRAHSFTKIELLDSLFVLYSQQKIWEEAQAVALERLSLREVSDQSKASQDVLSDVLELTRVLMERRFYAEAHLQARRALKGYRKLGANGESGVMDSLDLLIQICEGEGKLEELDAYKSHRSELTASLQPTVVLETKVDESVTRTAEEVPQVQHEIGRHISEESTVNPADKPSIEDVTPETQTVLEGYAQSEKEEEQPRSTSPEQKMTNESQRNLKEILEYAATPDKLSPWWEKQPKAYVVGDSNSGKTSLVLSQPHKEWDYDLVRDQSSYTAISEGDEISGLVMSVSGTDSDGREAAYKAADVILLCVDIGKPERLGEIFTSFVPEIAAFSPDIPLILVGCKGDLRSVSDTVIIPRTQLEDIAARIYALCYIECSAKTKENVESVFLEAHKAAKMGIIKEARYNPTSSNRPTTSSAKSLVGGIYGHTRYPNVYAQPKKSKWNLPWK